MVSSIALPLFGVSSTSTSTGFGLDASLLTAWASAKAGVPSTDTVSIGADPDAPTPPWTPGYTPSDGALATAALAGKAFFDPSAALYAKSSMDDDYRQLFAMYQGIKTLSSLASLAEATDITASQLAKTQAAFSRGLAEMQDYIGEANLDGVRVAQGDRVDAAKTKLGIPKITSDYTTGMIVRGSLTSSIPGLASDATFEIVAKSLGGAERRVLIDLAEMGSLPRSLGQIVKFMNQELAAAGVATRIETVNQAPKTQNVQIGGQTVERAYTGLGQWALKIDVNAGETVSFEAPSTKPAFYAVGSSLNGSSLVKLEDTDGAAGQPMWLTRPDVTQNPIGALLATGFLGAGEPYQSAPAESWETKTRPMVSAGDTNNVEKSLKAAGEAVLKLSLEDGRQITITTGWKSKDLENWRVRAGETLEQGMLDDLAERLTQLLHEQGIAAGVDSWMAGEDGGLSVFTGDSVTVDSLTISGKAVNLEAGRAPAGGFEGGLRAGVYARAFETGVVADVGDLFTENQTFTFTLPGGAKSIVIDGDEDGVDAATLITKLNEKLQSNGIPAAASFVENAGKLKLHINALHGVTAVRATLNEAAHDGVLLAPGAWVNGGLPVAAAGEPFANALRTYQNTGASPLIANSGALDVSIVIATATGDKTVNVQVTAQERLDNPDASAGEWNAIFQNRLNAALNAAGVYVRADDSALSSFTVAEESGQRLSSVTVNGQALSFEADAPSFGYGGAFEARRSFTSANAASGVSDDVPALISNPNMSVTIDTVWGQKTISAVLEAGDPRTLEAAALRLNEALAKAGYDAGVVATNLSGGGAGLRVVTGASDTISRVREVSIGGTAHAATLDAIDAVSAADDPVGALSVAERASRNASVLAKDPFTGTSIYQAPAGGPGNWFPGRDFALTLGQGAKVLAARATATGPDGAVYVIADVSGLAGDQPVKGEQDVALIKYDSAGKLMYTRTLGVSDSAEGYALAVAADGKVAVAGSVTGAMAGGDASAGKSDSFVRMYDDEGVELWTQRRGSSADDKVTALQFTSSGQLIAAGVTGAAMQGQVSAGGQDSYVRGYSATGVTLFTKQFGTIGADNASALLVRDAGGGAIDIFVGGTENNRGVVRAFTYGASTGLSVGATRDLGNFYNGGINSLAHDGTALYVGGAIGADRLEVGNAARISAAGKEGFVAKIDDGLVSTALDRTTYLGSAQNDSVTGIAIVNGDIYAMGETEGVIGGAGTAKNKSAFLTRLSDDGDVSWTRTFAGPSGTLTPTGFAVDATGASVLDRLGLPRGSIVADDATELVKRSSLRVGDYFFVGVNDRVQRRISITAKDTLQTVARKIDSALGGRGVARVVTEGSTQRIEITARDGDAVRLNPGADGKDALGGLGLIEGVIAKKTNVRGAIRTFGLGLIASDLKLTSENSITKAKADLAAATSILRQAYDALANPNAKELTAEEKALAARKNAGSVPSYLTKQLTNYQAALARLSG